MVNKNLGRNALDYRDCRPAVCEVGRLGALRQPGLGKLVPWKGTGAKLIANCGFVNQFLPVKKTGRAWLSPPARTTNSLPPQPQAELHLTRVVSRCLGADAAKLSWVVEVN